MNLRSTAIDRMSGCVHAGQITAAAGRKAHTAQ